MAAIQFDGDVQATGPVFDGSAAGIITEGTEAIRHALAVRAERLVAGAFSAAIRRDSGVFLSTITDITASRVFEWGGDEGRKTYTMPVVVADPVTDTVVTTELATYGPWLEGTGSRNETTRFKGYHGFRLAAQALDVQAGTIAEDQMQPFIVRCNA